MDLTWHCWWTVSFVYGEYFNSIPKTLIGKCKTFQEKTDGYRETVFFVVCLSSEACSQFLLLIQLTHLSPLSPENDAEMLFSDQEHSFPAWSFAGWISESCCFQLLCKVNINSFYRRHHSFEFCIKKSKISPCKLLICRLITAKPERNCCMWLTMMISE